MTSNISKWYHLNRHNTLPCKHCDGIVCALPWCMCIDPDVLYAYEVVAEPRKLSIGDALILHALGVAWDDTRVGEPTPGSCPAADLMLDMPHFGVA